MAYSPLNPPKCVGPNLGSAPAVWVYTSADAHGDVDAAGYFADGSTLGMKVGDVVIVQTTPGYATTLHSVSAVANGAATIAAAVLA